MFENVKRTETPKDTLINAVIEMEWQMFDRVNNQGGRADCQDDAWTFYVMRYSQFSAWPLQLISSYRQDAEDAAKQGRNLLTEKYAYMMAYTAPALYEEKLKPYLPTVTEKKQALVEAVGEWLMADESRFADCYPVLMQKGRPLHESNAQSVSVNHYMLGELQTYSLRTLSLYRSYLDALAPTVEDGVAVHVYKTMISFYGYDSLDAANRL